MSDINIICNFSPSSILLFNFEKSVKVHKRPMQTQIVELNSLFKFSTRLEICGTKENLINIESLWYFQKGFAKFMARFGSKISLDRIVN